MFTNEDEYLDSLKQEESYHFSIPFEYIEKNYGNDNYDIATTTMEVEVQWNEYEHGYSISYYVPEMYLINPSEGNGSEDDFYHSAVEDIVLQELSMRGITYEALVGGTGT